jgi:hypothetical protein
VFVCARVTEEMVGDVSHQPPTYLDIRPPRPVRQLQWRMVTVVNGILLIHIIRPDVTFITRFCVTLILVTLSLSLSLSMYVCMSRQPRLTIHAYIERESERGSLFDYSYIERERERERGSCGREREDLFFFLSVGRFRG